MEPIRKPSDFPGQVQSEEDEALAHRRRRDVREMTWTHLQAAHRRFLGYQDAENDDAAYEESQMVLIWMERWNEDGDA